MNLFDEQEEYVLPVIAASELTRFGIAQQAVRMVVVQNGCAVLVNGSPVFGTQLPGMSSERLQLAVKTWSELDDTGRKQVYERRWREPYSAGLAMALVGLGLAAQSPKGTA